MELALKNVPSSDGKVYVRCDVSAMQLSSVPHHALFLSVGTSDMWIGSYK